MLTKSNNENVENSIELPEEKVLLPELRKFGNENWDYMNNDMVVKLMKKVNICFIEIVKKIYFNVEHSENMNIQITNKKENTIRVYDGQEWVTQNRNDLVDTLINNLINKLENYEEYFRKKRQIYKICG